MLGVDPPDHTRLRAAGVARVHPARASTALQARVQAIVDDLLDEPGRPRRPDRAVDLVAGFAFPLPFTVICELLGVPEPDRADLGRWFRTLLAPDAGPQPPAERGGGVRRGRRRSSRAARPQARAPGDDLVSDLVVAGDGDGALTEQELLSTIFQLIVAGHDTTTSLIGNAIVALLRHPAQLAALVADPA